MISDVTASAVFMPDTIAINQTSQLTLSMTNNTGVQQDALSLTVPLPSATGGVGQLSVANPANASNGCGGTLNGVKGVSPGDKTLTLAGVTLAPGNTCQVTVTVVASGTGTYTIPASSVTFTFDLTNKVSFSWSSGRLVVNPPGTRHLFVPIPSSSANPAEILAYTPNNNTPACRITSTAFPNPMMIATSPFNGNVYVYDKSRSVSVLSYASLSSCSGGATISATPASTFALAYTGTGLAVSPLGQVIVTDGTVNGSGAAFFYDDAGVQKSAIYPPTSGARWTDVATMGGNIFFYDWEWYEITEWNQALAQPQVCGWYVDQLFLDPYDNTTGTGTSPTPFFHMTAGGGYVWLATSYMYQQVKPVRGYGEVFAVNPCDNENAVNWLETGPGLYDGFDHSGIGAMNPFISPSSIAYDPVTMSVGVGSIIYTYGQPKVSVFPDSNILTINSQNYATNATPSYVYSGGEPTNGYMPSGFAYGW